MSTPAKHLTARRFDFVGGLLRASHTRTSDGALLCEGVPVREGILVYRRADGSTVRELVTKEAVLDTARTLARAPVTLEHPEDTFVSPANVGTYGVGDVDGTADVEEDAQGSFAKVRIAIRRQDAIDAARSDKSELSPGYTATIDPTPGEHPIFGRYDARQIGRDANHLAIVSQGRGGPTVRLRADSQDAVMVSAAPPAAAPAAAPITPSARRADQERSVNPALAALAGRLGLSVRKDADDTMLIDLISEAVAGKMAAADQEKKAIEVEFDAFKSSASDAEKAAADALKAAGAADLPALAAKVTSLQADLDKVTGERDALKADMEKAKDDTQAKADAAELVELQGIATTLKVDSKGLDLAALKVKLAASRVDGVTAETPAARIDGILEVVRADSKRQATKDARYDGFRADKGGAGEGDGARNDSIDNLLIPNTWASAS